MRAVCSGTRGRGCCGWSDIAKPPEITAPTPLSTLRLTHSPTVSSSFWDSSILLPGAGTPLAVREPAVVKAGTAAPQGIALTGGGTSALSLAYWLQGCGRCFSRKVTIFSFVEEV